jgi:uncharacterized protein (TIGR03000 family)
MKRFFFLALLGVLSGVAAARAQSPVTEGGIPVPPPANSWFSGSPDTPATPRLAAPAYAPAAPARVVYVPVAAPAARPAGESPAALVVRLPADARLRIDGEATRAGGELRHFLSPPLAAGKAYHYVLEADLPREGTTLTVRREVAVRAGQQSAVSLTFPDFQVGAR